jgi:CoA:oxalate CoA-transferase
VPAGEVLSIPEVLQHPQTVSRGLLKKFSSAPGVDREIAVVCAGFHLASGNPGPTTPPPALGADTEQILEELGYNKETIAKLRNQGTV